MHPDVISIFLVSPGVSFPLFLKYWACERGPIVVFVLVSYVSSTLHKCMEIYTSQMHGNFNINGQEKKMLGLELKNLTGSNFVGKTTDII